MFPEQSDVAFNLWGLIMNFGMLYTYSTSTIFCVYTKLYVLIGMISLGVVNYGENFITFTRLVSLGLSYVSSYIAFLSFYSKIFARSFRQRC